ncbi:hypothetical protein O181_048525 [Austropuccinia psidii MF-1]|uniref:Uncharacterized protein n=1 Tax=Austropuccinia psidii MF-1 TaxID=1389203 RepID=A0A9Q3HPA1_9BASI|nr:hypothetical protein [Austropuccinia psidii MF-1]
MEATIQSNQMDVDKEEARPSPEVEILRQERHIWRMPELPPIPQGEDHRYLRRMKTTIFQRQGQNNKELVEEPTSFINGPEEGTGNDSSFGERRLISSYQFQTSSKSVQRQAQRTSEKAERSQEPSWKRQRQNKLAQTIPTRVQDPQIGAFYVARTLMEFTAKDQERMNRTFPCK